MSDVVTTKNGTGKKIIIVTIITILVSATLVAFSFGVRLFADIAQYFIATNHLKNERYDKAISGFEKLDGFWKSEEKIEEAKQGFYLSGVEFMENGEYYDAIYAFWMLGNDYLDCKERISACKPRAYEKACQYLNSGDYANALVFFRAAYGYLDSAEYISRFEVEYDELDSKYYTEKYTYNSDGLVIKYETENANNKSIREKFYNEKGLLIKEISTTKQTYFLSRHRFSNIYEYTYDDMGNLIKKTEHYEDSDGGITDYVYKYTYDDNGNLLTEKYEYDSSRDDLTQKGTREYTYNLNGDVIREVYNGTNSRLGPSSYDYIYEPTYDEKGNCTSYICTDSDGVLIEEMARTFDDYGNETWYKYNKPSINNRNEYTCSYTYDENGNILTKEKHDKNSINISTYVYNSFGDIVEHTYKHVSLGGGEQSVEPTVFTYKHDKYGNDGDYEYKGIRVTYNP